MALHNVPESDSFDTNVQMPADGDSADSSDFESSTIRPLVNRLRWLKGKVDYILRLFSGGSVDTTENATLTIADGKKLTIQSNSAGADDGALDLKEVYTDFHGYVRGPLFLAGGTGRANLKPGTYTPSGNMLVNARKYNFLSLTPSANIDVTLETDAEYFEGDHLWVVNHASGFQISVKNPAGTNIVILHSRSADHPSWGLVYYEGGVWRAGPWFQAS